MIPIEAINVISNYYVYKKQVLRGKLAGKGHDLPGRPK
jgi:hypothetical protein